MATLYSTGIRQPQPEPWKEPDVTDDNIWDKMRNFDVMSDEQKKDVYKFVVTGAGRYATRYYISDLMGKPDFTKAEKFKLFEKYLSEGGYNSDDDSIFTTAYTLDAELTKKYIKQDKDGLMSRRLVTMKGYTVEDEVVALRALTRSKYSPMYLYENKYAPSLDALRELAPIMRLKALEALTSNIHVSYNVFKNITDADEFKKLLFGSVIRHRDRVEAVWEKYNEIKHTGIQGTVIAKFTCKNCQDYQITLTSSVVRTRTKLEQTNIGRNLMHKSCLICGTWNAAEGPVISGDIEGLNG